MCVRVCSLSGAVGTWGIGNIQCGSATIMISWMLPMNNVLFVLPLFSECFPCAEYCRDSFIYHILCANARVCVVCSDSLETRVGFLGISSRKFAKQHNIWNYLPLTSNQVTLHNAYTPSIRGNRGWEGDRERELMRMTPTEEKWKKIQCHQHNIDILIAQIDILYTVCSVHRWQLLIDTRIDKSISNFYTLVSVRRRQQTRFDSIVKLNENKYIFSSDCSFGIRSADSAVHIRAESQIDFVQ